MVNTLFANCIYVGYFYVIILKCLKILCENCISISRHGRFDLFGNIDMPKYVGQNFIVKYLLNNDRLVGNTSQQNKLRMPLIWRRLKDDQDASIYCVDNFNIHKHFFLK